MLRTQLGMDSSHSEIKKDNEEKFAKSTSEIPEGTDILSELNKLMFDTITQPSSSSPKIKCQIPQSTHVITELLDSMVELGDFLVSTASSSSSSIQSSHSHSFVSHSTSFIVSSHSSTLFSSFDAKSSVFNTTSAQLLKLTKEKSKLSLYRRIVKKGLNENIIDNIMPNGKTLFYLALETRQFKKAEILFKCGANAHIGCPSRQETSYQLAVRRAKTKKTVPAALQTILDLLNKQNRKLPKIK